MSVYHFPPNGGYTAASGGNKVPYLPERPEYRPRRFKECGEVISFSSMSDGRHRKTVCSEPGEYDSGGYCPLHAMNHMSAGTLAQVRTWNASVLHKPSHVEAPQPHEADRIEREAGASSFPEEEPPMPVRAALDCVVQRYSIGEAIEQGHLLLAGALIVAYVDTTAAAIARVR